MLTTINTTFTDTRAGDLTWSLECGPQPALATLDLELADVSVQLRVLGASHQVLLNGSRGACAETVACLAGDNSPLPLGVSRRLGEFDYEFAAHVETLSAGSFAGRAQELLALVAEHPQGLAALFPGDPNAFTALLAQRQDGQVHWRTWHSYPQERRLVATRTRVVGALRTVETVGKSTPVGDRASSRCDVTFGS
ncbi:Protein of unknown function DUF2617 [Streptomyces zhaozhouensis]|uniref:DUF2617 domain-containing protein n=1 Tax=Streptomyces zhaozhouensis TaxID=1300267 RepID=A0A286DV02_9ACTN|nr:DUF2617 family protein [Streptomyces zhaozhouensis]SOD62492.1 Protein of unknown function DUF2617 [Streptomyces zhaozhouensis]